MLNFTQLLWLIAPLSAIIALITARFLYVALLKQDEGTDLMKEIAQHVREGAKAYLSQQYKLTAIVFISLFFFLGILAFLGIQSPFVPFIFLSGGISSGLCGYLGMKTATNASARTASACRESLNKGLKVSFRAGSVMGLIVVGFGLLDVSIWFTLLNWLYSGNVFGLAEPILQNLGISNLENLGSKTALFEWHILKEVTTTLLAYSMGASVMALFSRVGGGIYTKAADVGADLVGKVEAGIPEDDPRNPATIADNVGDNVGDVAGMGADLFESYCGSILAATALSTSLIFINGSIEYNKLLFGG